MSRTRIFIVAAALGLLLATVSDVMAQRPGYSRRPTSRSYADYFRSGIGLMDPDMAYLMPFMRQDRDLGRSRDTRASAPPSLEVQRAVAQSRQQQAIAGGVAPTGGGSTFMNLSHYYQSRNFRRR